MQNLLRPSLTAALLFISTIFTTSNAHNITDILSKHPEFSTFNKFLTLTHLAPEINGKQTITVLAVDNAAMHDLISKNTSISTVKNILSLHVLLDYFDAKKLHQIRNGTANIATMFQATGHVTGTSGFVTITDLHGGKVGFGAQDNDGTLPASYVKSVQEIPYNISVIQISQIIPSAAAEAPTPPPTAQNITDIMSKHGCKFFAETLAASEALSTFIDNIAGGLTVFCPADNAFKAFLPKFKNLTVSGKSALLEFHGVPVYQSKADLKSGNGNMNTLATENGKNYQFNVQNDGEEITLKTKTVTARIIDTILDEYPEAIYTISKVLLPEELFKGKAQSPSPSPAPEPAAADAPAADAPQPPKKKGKKKAPAEDDSDSPADSPDDSADDNADDNDGGGAAVRVNGIFVMILSLGLGLGFLML